MTKSREHDRRRETKHGIARGVHVLRRIVVYHRGNQGPFQEAHVEEPGTLPNLSRSPVQKGGEPKKRRKPISGRGRSQGVHKAAWHKLVPIDDRTKRAISEASTSSGPRPNARLDLSRTEASRPDRSTGPEFFAPLPQAAEEEDQRPYVAELLAIDNQFCAVETLLCPYPGLHAVMTRETAAQLGVKLLPLTPNTAMHNQIKTSIGMVSASVCAFIIIKSRKHDVPPVRFRVLVVDKAEVPSRYQYEGLFLGGEYMRLLMQNGIPMTSSVFLPLESYRMRNNVPMVPQLVVTGVPSEPPTTPMLSRPMEPASPYHSLQPPPTRSSSIPSPQLRVSAPSGQHLSSPAPSHSRSTVSRSNWLTANTSDRGEDSASVTSLGSFPDRLVRLDIGAKPTAGSSSHRSSGGRSMLGSNLGDLSLPPPPQSKPSSFTLGVFRPPDPRMPPSPALQTSMANLPVPQPRRPSPMAPGMMRSVSQRNYHAPAGPPGGAPLFPDGMIPRHALENRAGEERYERGQDWQYGQPG